MRKKIALIAAVILASSSAYANNTCTGKVTGVSVSQSGNVLATIRNTSLSTNLADVVMCNVNPSTDNTAFSGEACKGLMSLLLSASAMQKNTILWFQAASFTSCTQSWMNLRNMGFYHFRIDG